MVPALNLLMADAENSPLFQWQPLPLEFGQDLALEEVHLTLDLIPPHNTLLDIPEEPFRTAFLDRC